MKEEREESQSSNVLSRIPSDFSLASSIFSEYKVK